MNVSKKKIVGLAIGVVILAVLSFAMFVSVPERDGQFWVTYGFAVIGVVWLLVNCARLKSNNTHFAANLSAVTISAVYLLADAACSIVLSGIFRMEFVRYLVVHIVLLGIFAVLWLIDILVIGYMNSQDRS